MATIHFDKRFVAAILSGKKTTTLRRWKSARVKPGTQAKAPGVGSLNILACEPIELKDLTEADALADGFATLDDLFQTLNEFYPDQQSDKKRWYKVTFSLSSHSSPAPEASRIGHLNRPKTPGHSQIRRKTLRKSARMQLMRQIRADLDKAVRQRGSLPSV